MARSTGSAIALIAVGLLALAGCDVAGPPSPTPTARPTHRDPQLEALMPTEVDGVRLAISSVAASDLVGTAAEASLSELAGALGRPLSDLTLAAAVDPTGQLQGGINAMRVRGGSGAELLTAILAVEQRTVPTEVTQAGLAGRSVTRLVQREGDTTATRFLLADGEVVFIILSPDDATAERYVGALP